MVLRKEHRPRGRGQNVRRSAAVAKDGGVPYTPKSQMQLPVPRNASRVGTSNTGSNVPHQNNLVALLTLTTVSLAERLVALGFLRPMQKCPRCGGALGPLKSLSNLRYPMYRCSSCRGNSAYVSCLHGSPLQAAKHLSLFQLAALLICFSESVAVIQAAAICGISYVSTCKWYSMFRDILSGHMVKLQKRFGKQGDVGVIAEADEACVSKDPVVERKSSKKRKLPKGTTLRKDGKPKYMYVRIIALLVRGSRNLIIELLPIKYQNYRRSGRQKTMSGGTVYYKGNRWQPPAPPPLSEPEGRRFLKKYFRRGILSTDSAKTYNLLVNKKKMFGALSKQIRVVHGKGEFTRLFPDKVWGGTQFMDGYFGNLKQFLKPRHITVDNVMPYVREHQYWFVTRKQDRLVAFGDAFRGF